MDAHLDTLSTEMYQVNVRVSCIARRQATMGRFAPEATPSPPSIDSDSNDDDDASENDNDGDISSTDETFTWYSYPLSLVTKKGSSFGFESSHT